MRPLCLVLEVARPSVTDPRVDDHVQEVHDKVGEADQGGVHREHSDDDEVVAVENALGELLAQPRNAEEVLDNDAASDDADGQRTKDRDDRDECVAQGVPSNDHSLPETLGTGGPDVVLSDDLEHARPGQARDDARIWESEGKGRQPKLAEVAMPLPQLVVEGAVGDVVEPDPEN